MDADLKAHLEAMERRLNGHFSTKIEGLENSVVGPDKGLVSLVGLENRLIETMRDVQTELLRAFAAEDQTIQLRKM